MTNSKNKTKRFKLLQNKSQKTIEKIQNFLSPDLSNLVKKNKITKKSGDIDSIESIKNTEKPEKFEKAKYQSANLSKSQNNGADDTNIPQTFLSKHRLKQNKKNMQTDAFISYVAQPQHTFTITEVKPQQAVMLSEIKKPQTRKAPYSASIVETPKPPQLRSIEEDIALKAKKDQSIKTSHAISKGFDELDKMIDTFQAQNLESHKADNLPQNSSNINSAKGLISKFEQETNDSQSQLNNKKFYGDMYESLAPSEKIKTSKDMFLQNAKNHQIKKIVQNMQLNVSKSANKVSPSETPNLHTASLSKAKSNKGFSI